MFNLSVNSHLQTEQLFNLFKQQLKKDMEGAGWDGGFTEQLPSDFNQLKAVIVQQIQLNTKHSALALNALLYRVDLSEMQIKKYKQLNPHLNFEELYAELIIKRILQKIIIKKNFS